MRESPRLRRLRSDFRAMNQLRQESSVIDFSTAGDPPDRYIVSFLGQGVHRSENGNDILLRHRHEVSISLGASYPRMIPELQWRTPIFHPNISASGVVCLGGYGTYWVPSLTLDELCTMLWDMIRYQNFDVESPYNREAALWTKQQQQFIFPVDRRPIRDRVASGMMPSASVTKRQEAMLVAPIEDAPLANGHGQQINGEGANARPATGSAASESVTEPNENSVGTDANPDPRPVDMHSTWAGGREPASDTTTPTDQTPAGGQTAPTPMAPRPNESGGNDDDGLIFLGDVEETSGSNHSSTSDDPEDDILFIE